MKTLKANTSKLVTGFDKQLMNILLSDLKSIKAKKS
jgi:hypothetical protein